jgi:hypothetical protein
VGEPSAEPPISLIDLEARHDDLLDQLDELEQRIASVLKEHLPARQITVEATEEPLATPDSAVPPAEIRPAA